ncbi:MAG: hypothetical protein AAGG38_10235 [Planctomycetota bacterium]
MKTVWTTLLIRDNAWVIGLSDGSAARVIELPFDSADTSAQSKVDLALDQIKRTDARIGPLVLGLPSAWCLAAAVPTDGLQRRQRHQGLIYRLEERLPINAEDFTANFTAPGNALRTSRESASGATPGNHKQTSVLGVAVRHERVAPILEALETKGLNVAHLTPTTWLAHAALEPQRLPDGSNHRLAALASGPETCDLFLCEYGRITRWRHVHRDLRALNAERQVLAGHLDRREVAVAAVGLTDAERQTLSSEAPPLPTAKMDGPGQDTDSLAVAHATELLKQDQAPALDLRCGTLSGRGMWPRIAGPAISAVAAAALLLLSFGGLNTWRAYQATSAAETHDQAQITLYRQTFPGQRVPAAVLSRFRSEAAKAKGLTGDSDTLPPPARTLADLRDVLTGLSVSTAPSARNTRSPSGAERMRFRVDELRIEPRRLYLDGRVRSHADADRLVAGLQATVDYTLDAPRTQNLGSRPENRRNDRGNHEKVQTAVKPVVTLTLTGHRAEDPS